MIEIGEPEELLIIAVLVILLFGVGRVDKIGSELGKSIRDFRKALQGTDNQPAKPAPTPPTIPPVAVKPSPPPTSPTSEH